MCFRVKWHLSNKAGHILKIAVFMCGDMKKSIYKNYSIHVWGHEEEYHYNMNNIRRKTVAGL